MALFLASLASKRLSVMARLLFTNKLEDYARRLGWVRDALWRLEAWLVAGMLKVFARLSLKRASSIGQALLAKLGPVSPKHKLVLDNIDITCGERDTSTRARIASRAWREVGALFGELTQFDKIARAPDEYLQIVALCDLEPYRRRERAGIFASAHIANWEILLLVFTLERIPALSFYAPLQNPHLARLLTSIRAATGCVMHNRDGSLKPIIRHVRAGGSVGTMMDVRVDGGLEVPFFGHPMQISATPARLALRYGCDLIPYQCERLADGKLRATIHAPIATEGLAGDESAQLRELSARHLGLVEDWVRASPESWLMTTRRWERRHYPRTKGRAT